MAVPAGWKQYKDIVGRFTFMYPPSWGIESQAAGSVIFGATEWALCGIKVGESPYIDPVGMNDEANLDYVVTKAAEIDPNHLFKMLDKGIWQDRGYFVSFTDKTSDSDRITYWLHLNVPLGHGNFAFLAFSNFSPITEEEMDTFDAVLSTLRLEEPMQAQTVAPTSQAELPASLGTPTGTPTTTGMVQVKKSANLRQGPGTNYAVVGSVEAGDVLELLGRNEAGDWLYVKTLIGRVWIAAFLVEHGDISDLPVEQSIAPTVTPAPQPTAVSRSIVQIGEEIEGGGWRFKVSETHKRKAVYFYGRPFVAQGHFLVVIIEAVNLQSGTDYFAHNLKPWITEAKAPTTYLPSSTGSTYAQWQYEGLSGIFTYVNPGNFSRIAVAFDLPDNLEEIRLSTDIPKWIDLGNFSAMPSEDD